MTEIKGTIFSREGTIYRVESPAVFATYRVTVTAARNYELSFMTPNGWTLFGNVDAPESPTKAQKADAVLELHRFLHGGTA